MNITTTPPEIETKLQRIQRLSVVLRALCTGLLVIALIGSAAATIASLVGRGATVRFFEQAIPVSGLSLGARVIVAIVCLISGAVLAKGLWHFRQLLNNYARRQVFTNDCARQIRQLGYVFLATGVIKIAWAFLPAIVAHSERTSPVTIDPFVMGAVVIVISWFTEMATIIREETDLTV